LNSTHVPINGRYIRDVYDLLDLVRERPGMWIGECTLPVLRAYLEGFSLALYCAGIAFKSEPDFDLFQEWVTKRLGLERGEEGWPQLLLDSVNGNESLAFQRFWEEVDLYRQSDGH
jgi:hypothetical protein